VEPTKVSRQPPSTSHESKCRQSSRLLTVEEVAERLNVSVRNVRHQIFQRRLAVVKIGRLVRVDERDLEALIERGRVSWF
jgi:excisionase family DNA binding protein